MTHIILKCPACGQANRVPAERLAQRPRCGKCHKDQFLGAPIEVDEATLAGLIRESSLPLLVDFWAPLGGGPCRTVAPVLQQVAAAHANQALVLKVNVDQAQGAAREHQVSGIPALVLFQGGRERERLVGAHPRANIERLLAAYLSGPAQATL